MRGMGNTCIFSRLGLGIGALFFVFCGSLPVLAQDPAVQPSDDQELKVESQETLPEIYAGLDAAYCAAASMDKRETGLKQLRDQLKAYPDDYGILWRAARMTWFIGDGMEDDQGDALKELGIEGMDYADRALLAQPDSIEGHYYKALTISTYSRGISIVKALVKGLGGEYEKNVQFVLDRDERFDRGGALRAFGRYYWKLPWPKYDHKKSLEYLDRAMEVDPTVLRTSFYRGDTLWALKRYKLAREAFEIAVNTEPTDADFNDASWIKAKAKMRLKELIRKKF